MEKISTLPAEKRPREKLIDQGVAALSDPELVALLIGSGTGKTGVEQITAGVLEILDKKKRSYRAGGSDHGSRCRTGQGNNSSSRP